VRRKGDYQAAEERPRGFVSSFSLWGPKLKVGACWSCWSAGSAGQPSAAAGTAARPAPQPAQHRSLPSTATSHEPTAVA